MLLNANVILTVTNGEKNSVFFSHQVFRLKSPKGHFNEMCILRLHDLKKLT